MPGFRVPGGVSKGRKYRTTWIGRAALEAVHRYIACRPRIRGQATSRIWIGDLGVTRVRCGSVDLDLR
jgi:site-specific recombinase XerC